MRESDVLEGTFLYFILMLRQSSLYDIKLIVAFVRCCYKKHMSAQCKMYIKNIYKTGVLKNNKNHIKEHP